MEQKPGRGNGIKQALVLFSPSPGGPLSEGPPPDSGAKSGWLLQMDHIAWPPRASAEARAPGSGFHMTRGSLSGPSKETLNLPWCLHIPGFSGERGFSRNVDHLQSQWWPLFLAGVAALVRGLRCRGHFPWTDVWDPYLGQGFLLSCVPGNEISCLITQG